MSEIENILYSITKTSTATVGAALYSFRCNGNSTIGGALCREMWPNSDLRDGWQLVGGVSSVAVPLNPGQGQMIHTQAIAR